MKCILAEKRRVLDWNKGNIIDSYFVAGSSKEATNTSVPSWSGRRNFNRSDTSVEKDWMRYALFMVVVNYTTVIWFKVAMHSYCSKYRI